MGPLRVGATWRRGGPGDGRRRVGCLVSGRRLSRAAELGLPRACRPAAQLRLRGGDLPLRRSLRALRARGVQR
eukprot:15477236-Alexandrium_andersonii.AAC.1